MMLSVSLGKVLRDDADHKKEIRSSLSEAASEVTAAEKVQKLPQVTMSALSVGWRNDGAVRYPATPVMNTF